MNRRNEGIQFGGREHLEAMRRTMLKLKEMAAGETPITIEPHRYDPISPELADAIKAEGGTVN